MLCIQALALRPVIPALGTIMGRSQPPLFHETLPQKTRNEAPERCLSG